MSKFNIQYMTDSGNVYCKKKHHPIITVQLVILTCSCYGDTFKPNVPSLWPWLDLLRSNCFGEQTMTPYVARTLTLTNVSLVGNWTPPAPPGQSNETYFFGLLSMSREQISMLTGWTNVPWVHLAAILDFVIRELRKLIIFIALEPSDIET